MITNPTLGSFSGTKGEVFFSGFFGNLISLALVAGTVIFFFMLIMGAISWIGSGGDKGAMEQSKSKITNALIGIIIMFAIFAIVGLISAFFGNIDLFNLTLTPVTP